MSKPVTTIRHSVLARSPIGRALYRPLPDRVFPGWLRRLLLALLALLLLLTALVSCHESRKPASLATSALIGPRLTTGPVCLEEAVDISGSMTQYTGEREHAERELFAFARRELGKDDLFSEAFFAGSARLAVPPTPMVKLNAAPSESGQLDGGTSLTPAVATLVAARTHTACAARALVMITDGLIYDDDLRLPVRDTLSAAAYTRMFAVVPSGATGAGRGNLNGGLLDSVTVYGFEDGGLSGRARSIIGNARPLDVIFGDILGSLTGQRLGRAPATPGPSPT